MSCGLAKKIDGMLEERFRLAQRVKDDCWIPFFCRGERCGSVKRDVAEFLAAGFRFLDYSEDSLAISAADTDECSRRFAALSITLKQLGMVRAWRDELLPVVPLGQEYPEPHLAVIERAVCRTFALTTYAVHLNPFSTDGRIWIAQRSKKKAIGPGKWDNCAAGIVPFGEKFGPAMEREAYEEAGVIPGSLQFRMINRHLNSRPVNEGWMEENTVVYTADVPDSFHPHNMDGEVEQFLLADFETVVQMVEEGLFTFESALSTLIAIRGRL